MKENPSIAAPLLSVRDLTVRYGPALSPAVNRVGFDIAPGEIFGLAGESGCGKSTIANTILRLLKPPAEITGGSMSFRGVDLLGLGEESLRQMRWSEIAMVFQSAMNALNPVMTVGDQLLDVFPAHGQRDRKIARERAASLLELVGIAPDRLNSYPHQLSGGMRQRVVIAIALALEPDLLILDEPTTALDVVVQQDIMQQIQALQSDLGFAVLFITHDISLMVEFSHRMAVMYAGRIVESAPATEIFRAPEHPYTRALMGAFPPLSGPRRELTGLGGSVGDRSASQLGFDPVNIPDLAEGEPDHWTAPHTGVLEEARS